MMKRRPAAVGGILEMPIAAALRAGDKMKMAGGRKDKPPCPLPLEERKSPRLQLTFAECVD
jgi:hypothetical protein